LSSDRVRVLVVDDSAFARKVLREVLSADPRIDVVGFARDGLDALEQITVLKPAVITLDLVMPELDGIGVLRALRTMPDPPQVVLVTMTDEHSELGIAALQEGAFEILHKPTALATDRLYELRDELVRKVIAAAQRDPGSKPPKDPEAVAAPQRRAPPSPFKLHAAERAKVVMIGASTGGPRAVTDLLCALPANFPVPVAVVVHMPPGFTEAFARRLNERAALEVREAHHGLPMVPGRVVVGRAGLHLKFRRSGDDVIATLASEPTDLPHRPAVDELFASAALEWGAGVLAVVLTGMGNDGLEGSRKVHAAGGRILTESAATAVVYGMPRAVTEHGLAEAELPLHAMAAAIVSRT
jgi:two-component system chemotaxis response regulator CheB